MRVSTLLRLKSLDGMFVGFITPLIDRSYFITFVSTYGFSSMLVEVYVTLCEYTVG